MPSRREAPGAAWLDARRLVGALVALALLLGGSPRALAQQDVGEGEARRLFDAADVAFQDGRLGQARELLERSLELYPHRATAYNLALALQRIGASTRAIGVLEDLLAGRFGALESSQIRQGETLLRQARADLASLEVRVEGPPTASVRVDGEIVGSAGRGRVVERAVDAGRHRVSASAPHHDPAEAVVEVARGQRAVAALSPTPHRATLVLTSERDIELEVLPFGRGKGSLRLELPAGTYRARALRDGRAREREVSLAPGQALSLRLAPPPPALVRHLALWIGSGVAVCTAVALGLWLGLREDPDPDVLFRVEALGDR